MLPEPLLVIKRLVELFGELQIEYLIGGSVASSLYGISRATNDVDFVVDLKPETVPALVKALEGEYYVDDEMILEAIETKSSCNVIHLTTMVKADFFIFQPTPWKKQAWERRRTQTITSEGEELSIQLASSEDMILQKLLWYRMGGGVSDRQWGDIQGMLKVQAPNLDFDYLHLWAADQRLTELLQKALTDAGLA